MHCKKQKQKRNAPFSLVTRPATWSLCLYGQGVWIRALTGECNGNFSHMKVERCRIDTCILGAQLPQRMCCLPLRANNKLLVFVWTEYMITVMYGLVILFKPAVQSTKSFRLYCFILLPFISNVDMVKKKKRKRWLKSGNIPDYHLDSGVSQRILYHCLEEVCVLRHILQ